MCGAHPSLCKDNVRGIVFFKENKKKVETNNPWILFSENGYSQKNIAA